jgi:hypothetical protein
MFRKKLNPCLLFFCLILIFTTFIASCNTPAPLEMKAPLAKLGDKKFSVKNEVSTNIVKTAGTCSSNPNSWCINDQTLTYNYQQTSFSCGCTVYANITATISGPLIKGSTVPFNGRAEITVGYTSTCVNYAEENNVSGTITVDSNGSMQGSFNATPYTVLLLRKDGLPTCNPGLQSGLLFSSISGTTSSYASIKTEASTDNKSFTVTPTNGTLPYTIKLTPISNSGSCPVSIPAKTGQTGTKTFALTEFADYVPNGDYIAEVSYEADESNKATTMVSSSVTGELSLNVSPNPVILQSGQGTVNFEVTSTNNQPWSLYGSGCPNDTVPGDIFGQGQCITASTCKNGNQTINWQVPANTPSGSYSVSVLYADNTGLKTINFPVNNPAIPLPTQSASATPVPIDFTVVNPEPFATPLSPSFDIIPNENLETVPGVVNVIYRNSNEIRIPRNDFRVQSTENKEKDEDNNNGHGNDPDKCDPGNPGNSKPECDRYSNNSNKTTIKSVNPEDAKALNKILKKYHIISASDLTLPGETVASINEQQVKVSQLVNGEVPNRLSLHFYRFPDREDTKALAEELRKLPFVRTAYRGLKALPSGNFELRGKSTVQDVAYKGAWYEGIPLPIPGNWSWHPSDNPHPDDEGFKNEASDWWHYNRIKAFQGWDVYAHHFGFNKIDDPNLPKPTIAVIDTGFDITGDDIPDYEGGVLMADNSLGIPDIYTVLSGKITMNDLRETTHHHGSVVANIIASPVNNGKGFCGIIPGAKIVPIKLDYSNGRDIPEKVAKAIFYISENYGVIDFNNQAGVHAINISIDRLTDDPIVGAAIIYTTYLANIPVVLGAGNDVVPFEKDNKPTSCTLFPDCINYGQIVVGGSDKDGKQWITTDTFGSNFGKGIDLAAPAEEIYNINSGTSFAAPQVTSTIAMMAKMNPSRFAQVNYVLNLKNMLILSSSVGVTDISPKFGEVYLGKDLENSAKNNGNIIKMRELNVYNALILARYLNANPYMIRIFNTEGHTKAVLNRDFSITPFAVVGEENDEFWSHDDTLPPQTSFTFLTNINNFSNESKTGTYGYQFYNLKDFNFSERMLGVTQKYSAYEYNYEEHPILSSETKLGLNLASNGDILEDDPENPGKACCDIKRK